MVGEGLNGGVQGVRGNGAIFRDARGEPGAGWRSLEGRSEKGRREREREIVALTRVRPVSLRLIDISNCFDGEEEVHRPRSPGAET